MTDATEPTTATLDAGTYEVLRNRLRSHGDELKSRLAKLNVDRKEAFGSIETALLTTERITTAHNCLSRDMVSVGQHVLFGYNIHFGLKSETDLADVFACYKFHDHSFHAASVADVFDDAEFAGHFRDLFRYYKDTTFAKFARRGPHVFMVFRVGRDVRDIKTFKWLIDGDRLKYLGNRSDHEYTFPPQHEFEWTRTTRDQHVSGSHPHVSIEDRVFVETVGGDLTIKVEDNTDSGEGLYAEPVDNADQQLDDAEISYAVLGHLILLKIRPYQEDVDRYFVFNEKLQEVRRLDAMAESCILLPDDHGLIFSSGYYLATGEGKTFDVDTEDMFFERRIEAPNGEDFLYVFYSRTSGEYVLLQYNLIEQRLQPPIACAGWTFFEAGELACFKSHADPQKHHAIQLWQTPYVGEDYVPPAQTESFLSKIGNKELVRGMAECHEILGLISKDDSYAGLYTDLVRQAGVVADSHFWMSKSEAHDLAAPLGEIKAAANAAVGEFEKVVRVRRETEQRTRTTQSNVDTLLGKLRSARLETTQSIVDGLSSLRSVRGEVISLRELKYVDATLIDTLEQRVVEATDKLSQKAVERFVEPSSLDSYRDAIAEAQGRIDALTKVTEAEELSEAIGQSASELEMLIEIVSNLKIDDATQRTAIIDNISAIFATINQSRAALKNKTRELAAVEGVAEFQSQMTLLNQSVANYLDLCDSPEKCDEYLTKLVVAIEELDGRFAEFDDFVLQLTDKREEIYNAFESRKLSLVETRNRRADSLVKAAERVLSGISSRVSQFDTVDEINAYFAADLMIEKVRDIITQLDDLGDSVKVDDVTSRLKTVREDAVRQLTDRSELFVDGENAIRFGEYTFNVNTQPLDLTTVVRDDELCIHLTGTNFYQAVVDERLLATRDVWDQAVISETRDVYRGEYLAYQLVQSWDDAEQATEFANVSSDEQLQTVQAFMAGRYEEAYTKGVHDTDATAIARAYTRKRDELSTLRYPGEARVRAELFWRSFAATPEGKSLAKRLQHVGAITRVFGTAPNRDEEIAALATLFGPSSTPPETMMNETSASFLYDVLTSPEVTFRHTQSGKRLLDDFVADLKTRKSITPYRQSIKQAGDLDARYRLSQQWLSAFANDQVESAHTNDLSEAALLAVLPDDQHQLVECSRSETLEDLLGSHARIQGGQFSFDLVDFETRLQHHTTIVAEKFHHYTALKHDVVEHAREDLRLNEFKPRVLTSFVRNKLIDEVYLPLIGANLAKQIGVAGEAKRTDLMGLLLLVSPPGYGKTTLMEYIANRLGLIFMKINGPALGHSVTSLDPAEAPNAGSREEVEKLNLALEMGDNVLIYVDDIQHTHPEFLQKFISLCDAQRKIEGVWNGRPQTYDLRGRKVAVVMAGNPYTESGERFQIPDMLANRADIYNLGEIIGDTQDAFEMSYLENSITSNPTLAPLAARGQGDVRAVIAMAAQENTAGQPQETIDFAGNESPEQIADYVSVMKKLLRVRDVILAVNQEYIRSAAQSDDYRTEPPFQLQGSYRNMNRIAEKVAPVMNDNELTGLIVTNYENDAQTLTSGAEVNLLKVRQLIGVATEDDLSRWGKIVRTYQENVRLKGIDADDKTGQVIARIGTLADNLDAIRTALTDGVSRLGERGQQDRGELASRLETLHTSLAAINDTLHTAIAQDPVETEDEPETLDSKITVVNRIPATVTSVLKAQFYLMRAWLEPIKASQDAQDRHLTRLHDKLDACMAAYDKLLGDVSNPTEPSIEIEPISGE